MTASHSHPQSSNLQMPSSVYFIVREVSGMQPRSSIERRARPHLDYEALTKHEVFLPS